MKYRNFGTEATQSEGQSYSPSNQNTAMNSAMKVLKGKNGKALSGETMKQSGKSPYLNDCFNKLQIGNQNTS